MVVYVPTERILTAGLVAPLHADHYPFQFLTSLTTLSKVIHLVGVWKFRNVRKALQVRTDIRTYMTCRCKMFNNFMSLNE